MSRNKPTSGARRSQTWKDIEQGVAPKAMNPSARRRSLVGACKRCSLVVALVVVGLLAIQFPILTNAGPSLLAKAGERLPINHIQVSSDGALRQDWVINRLKGVEEANLLEIDIQQIKDSLIAIPQVVDAAVRRKLSGSLMISIRERAPLARIVGRTADGKHLGLFVDREGEIFPGIGYRKQFIRALPALDGFRLKKTEDGFEPIEGMEQVELLLAEAQAIAPHLHRSWKVISLEQYPKIIARSRMVEEVVFEPGNFRKELARLDYILDYYRSELSAGVSKIDLTLGVQVPVSHKASL